MDLLPRELDMFTAPSGADGDAMLDRARQLVALAIRRRWDEGLLARDPDGVFTAFLGVDHIERLMEGPGERAPTARVRDFVPSPNTPIGRLARSLGLRPSQVDLLAVLLACEVDPSTSRLLAYLGGNQAQHAVTVDLVYEAVYRPRAERHTEASALLHRDLASYGLLCRLRFVIVDRADNRVFLAQGIRLHPRMVDFLVQGGEVDAELTAVAHLVPAARPEGECGAEELALVTAALAARDRLVLVEGMPRSGREILLRAAAHQLGRPLLLVGARGLSADRLVAAFREACIQSAILVLRDGKELMADADASVRLRDCLAVFPDALAIVATPGAAPLFVGLRPVTAVTVPVPPHGERFRLWSRYLGEHGLEEDELRRIAGIYNLGVGGIIEASAAAREAAQFARQPLQREHVSAAVRQLFESDLAQVARRMEVTQTWDDVVLPEEVSEGVGGIMDRIYLRGDVLGSWGFARKLGKGLGLTALFSGEPGTGKSMVAGLIARELGLDLYVVDLSRITSKWLGETEKNLGRAFDAAEAGHVLLLFDEADSVLGKRTSEMRGANDRYANLESNFILARLEQFQGIAFFTTNLASAIDPAMMRRMSVHIRFPFPDVEGRTELWRRMLPQEAPVTDDIDFETLARRFEVSGGFIRNIVVRAAFLAARSGQPIGMVELEHAAELEYRERGSLLVGGRLV